MSTPDLSPILEELAAGRITPAEASRRIDALTASGGGGGSAEQRPTGETEHGRPQYATHRSERVRPLDDEQPADIPPAAEAQPDPEPVDDGSGPSRGSVNGVERVSLRVVGRRVRIVGDRKVSTASVEGPNVVTRNGAVLEIRSDGEVGPSFDGFSVLRPPRSLDDVRALGLGKELVVRVNPVLTVDAEVTAGSLHSEKVPFLGKVRVTAGGARLLDVAVVEDALVQAGQATVAGTLRTGRSKLRAESGSLNVQLEDRSDVTVHSDAQLGRVSWSGQHTGAGDEVVMGHGNARLDVSVVMGHAQVRLGSGGEAGA
ncbi:hypothetical protein GC722_09870 [Auraticoccus sp. F435]|uniref:DUF4097 family beta strand repeat protein n=1 Tax=Auraticoccus cholistanensis TaxID=2656650 RepID=A0A6A9UUH8_9ACTN|nr:hypothetical protein [Auraticoccus cholistanensis]MVA76328.1 hypothetical protein [Auraticoccus cholistanensis]